MAKEEIKQGGKGLAIASLVLGILAIVNSFIPFLNVVSYIFAILAVIFGIIGIVKKTGRGMAIAGLVMGILSFIIATSINNSTSKVINEAVQETNSGYKDVNGKTKFLLNESFINSKEKITMIESNTDFRDYSPYATIKPGYKVIMAKFEIENVTTSNDDEIYVSGYDFHAYADGEAVESFYSANDTYKDISATLSKGKKTSGYVFYEVPENASEITIEYNPNFWVDGNLIEFIIQ